MHNLRLESLFRSIARDRLGYHGRFIVRGDPVCNAMVGEVSRKVPDDRADEVIMQVFGFRIKAYDMIDSRRVFVLVVVP